jgi:hypothetical protein
MRCANVLTWEINATDDDNGGRQTTDDGRQMTHFKSFLRHFFVGGGGVVWAKKFVTLRGLRISEKKEILRKPTVDIVS